MGTILATTTPHGDSSMQISLLCVPEEKTFENLNSEEQPTVLLASPLAGGECMLPYPMVLHYVRWSNKTLHSQHLKF